VQTPTGSSFCKRAKHAKSTRSMQSGSYCSCLQGFPGPLTGVGVKLADRGQGTGVATDDQWTGATNRAPRIVTQKWKLHNIVRHLIGYFLWRAYNGRQSAIFRCQSDALHTWPYSGDSSVRCKLEILTNLVVWLDPTSTHRLLVPLFRGS